MTDTDPEWYARYRRQVEAEYAERRMHREDVWAWLGQLRCFDPNRMYQILKGNA
jgi:hypothetical protein